MAWYIYTKDETLKSAPRRGWSRFVDLVGMADHEVLFTSDRGVYTPIGELGGEVFPDKFRICYIPRRGVYAVIDESRWTGFRQTDFWFFAEFPSLEGARAWTLARLGREEEI